MALVDFYWARARFCEDAARVNTDPAIIKSLRDEAARYRTLAKAMENHANENDPYIARGEERNRAADSDAPDQEESQISRKAGPNGSEG